MCIVEHTLQIYWIYKMWMVDQGILSTLLCSNKSHYLFILKFKCLYYEDRCYHRFTVQVIILYTINWLLCPLCQLTYLYIYFFKWEMSGVKTYICLCFSQGDRLRVEILSLSFTPSSSIALDQSVHQVYVEYRLLGVPMETTETPMSLRKPTDGEEIHYNFTRGNFPICVLTR